MGRCEASKLTESLGSGGVFSRGKLHCFSERNEVPLQLDLADRNLRAHSATTVPSLVIEQSHSSAINFVT